MLKLYQHKKINTKTKILLGASFVLIGAGFAFYFQDLEQQKVKISSDTIKGNSILGSVVEGRNDSTDKNTISTQSKLIYESRVIESKVKTSTAAIVSWSQNHSEEEPGLELRVNDGQEWSKWIKTGSGAEDRKDGAALVNSGIILSKNIHKIQYRFTLNNSEEEASPEIDLTSMKIETIDSSKGPSLSEKTAWQKITGLIGLKSDSATARPAGPPINSRLVWGSPEPYDSPRWTPEYEPLNRVVVHHTATTPEADSSAAVRAIWYYHANNLAWGDIGYNYLVDQAGNIFQGRYFDGNYAEANNVDVVGGHAYDNNRGTTGIAALGDFTNTAPTASLVHSIGEVAAYKGGPYDLNPAEGTTFGGNLLGHRDLLSTSCPGANLYAQIQTIRNVANALFPRYRVAQYSWQYVTQFVYSDPARQIPVDPYSNPLVTGRKLYLTVEARNTGSKKWYRDGANPVRLGTSNPRDRLSTFCDESSWLSCGRAANLAEPIVAPGQVGSFQFAVIIPANNNVGSDVTLKEYFTPLAEGVTWFNDPGLYWGFTVAKPYAWQYVNQYAYTDAAHLNPIDLNNTQVNSGQRIYLSVVARNVGSKAWTSAAPNPVRLGTSNPRDRTSAFYDSSSWLGASRTVNIAPASVAPGETGTFDFSIVIPPNNTGAEKQYKEYFSPLSEGVVWFNDPGQYWLIKVAP